MGKTVVPEAFIVHREQDFAVVRYKDDVPLHQRRHGPTKGRYVDYEEAEQYLYSLPAPLAALLRIEDRSEEWDEEVPNPCVSSGLCAYNEDVGTVVGESCGGQYCAAYAGV